jgi:hypothetical protein
MTVKQLQKYYNYDWQEFVERGGGSRRSWFRYQAAGEIPFGAQIRIQRATKGELKADKWWME